MMIKKRLEEDQIEARLEIEEEATSNSYHEDRDQEMEEITTEEEDEGIREDEEAEEREKVKGDEEEEDTEDEKGARGDERGAREDRGDEEGAREDKEDQRDAREDRSDGEDAREDRGDEEGAREDKGDQRDAREGRSDGEGEEKEDKEDQQDARQEKQDGKEEGNEDKEDQQDAREDKQDAKEEAKAPKDNLQHHQIIIKSDPTNSDHIKLSSSPTEIINLIPLASITTTTTPTNSSHPQPNDPYSSSQLIIDHHQSTHPFIETAALLAPTIPSPLLPRSSPSSSTPSELENSSRHKQHLSFDPIVLIIDNVDPADHRDHHPRDLGPLRRRGDRDDDHHSQRSQDSRPPNGNQIDPQASIRSTHSDRDRSKSCSNKRPIRLCTRKFSLPLNLSTNSLINHTTIHHLNHSNSSLSPSSSPSSTSLTVRELFEQTRIEIEEDDQFIPDPPRQLNLVLPLITRRPGRKAIRLQEQRRLERWQELHGAHRPNLKPTASGYHNLIHLSHSLRHRLNNSSIAVQLSTNTAINSIPSMITPSDLNHEAPSPKPVSKKLAPPIPHPIDNSPSALNPESTSSFSSAASSPSSSSASSSLNSSASDPPTPEPSRPPVSTRSHLSNPQNPSSAPPPADNRASPPRRWSRQLKFFRLNAPSYRSQTSQTTKHFAPNPAPEHPPPSSTTEGAPLKRVSTPHVSRRVAPSTGALLQRMSTNPTDGAPLQRSSTPGIRLLRSLTPGSALQRSSTLGTRLRRSLTVGAPSQSNYTPGTPLVPDLDSKVRITPLPSSRGRSKLNVLLKRLFNRSQSASRLDSGSSARLAQSNTDVPESGNDLHPASLSPLSIPNLNHSSVSLLVEGKTDLRHKEVLDKWGSRYKIGLRDCCQTCLKSANAADDDSHEIKFSDRALKHYHTQSWFLADTLKQGGIPAQLVKLISEELGPPYTCWVSDVLKS